MHTVIAESEFNDDRLLDRRLIGRFRLIVVVVVVVITALLTGQLTRVELVHLIIKSLSGQAHLQLNDDNLVVRHCVPDPGGDAAHGDLSGLGSTHLEVLKDSLKNIAGDEASQIAKVDKPGKVAWAQHKQRGVSLSIFVGRRNHFPERRIIEKNEIVAVEIIVPVIFPEYQQLAHVIGDTVDHVSGREDPVILRLDRQNAMVHPGWWVLEERSAREGGLDDCSW